jgi:hypothetical protein
MAITIDIKGDDVSYYNCLIWIIQVDRFGVDSIFKVNGLTIFTCGYGYKAKYAYQFDKDYLGPF